jgi:predicted ATPase
MLRKRFTTNQAEQSRIETMPSPFSTTNRLTSITLENFKGYARSQKIPIKPLTLIFGKNSAGKSSIFHALAFLKWCQSENNCNPDNVDLGWESISLGGISNLVHGHDLSRVMKIGLGFVRQRYWGDVQIDTEWQFQNLQ